LTINLAYDLAENNICVNAIIPGPIRTPFWSPLTQGVEDEESFFKIIGKSVPLQRVGTPEDIAGAALFFASNLSDFVTGQYLHVSGGQPLKPKEAPLPSMAVKK
jgi:NAD(P)-dependent dehydrogenase (short-subunit alcohol dehydrogenase family)